MDSLMKKPFRFDPHLINYQILFLSGFWYLNTPHKWKNVLYGLYRFFGLFFFSMTMAVQILDIYLMRNNSGKLIEDLCSIIVSFAVTIKIYLISYKAHKVEELQTEFIRLRTLRSRPGDQLIWKSSSRQIYKMTTMFYVLALPCAFAWMFFPALDDNRERKLPYPWILPVDVYSSPIYEIAYVIQSFFLISYLVNILSLDLGFCGFMVQIIAQYDILFGDIREIDTYHGYGDSHLTKEKIVRILKKSVKLHNKILRQINKLQLIHEDLFFVQMSLVSTMLAAIIVDVSLRNTGWSLKLLQRLLYVACVVIDIFFICYWATQLKEKSYSLVQALYDISWFQMDVRIRKIVIIMMMRAQLAPNLKTRFLLLGLPLFLDIMKYSYNAIALLQNWK